MDSNQKTRVLQDMPPKGGYGPIEWAKKLPPLQRYWGKSTTLCWSFNIFLIYFYCSIGFKALGALIAVSGFSGYMYLYHDKPKRWSQIFIEPRDQLLATLPLVWAEQDREFLRNLHHNREVERDLMKDEPGWVVGTWYGEPVFHQKDVWVNPNHFEQYAHSHWRSWYRRLMEHINH